MGRKLLFLSSSRIKVYIYWILFLSGYYSGQGITCFFISHFVNIQVWGRGKKLPATPSDFRITDQWQAREQCMLGGLISFPTVMLRAVVPEESKGKFVHLVTRPGTNFSWCNYGSSMGIRKCCNYADDFQRQHEIFYLSNQSQ